MLSGVIVEFIYVAMICRMLMKEACSGNMPLNVVRWEHCSHRTTMHFFHGAP